jgi:ATP-dependent Lhr-like helicase
VASLLVERANGVSVLTPDGPAAPALDALIDAGFSRTPRGLRLR